MKKRLVSGMKTFAKVNGALALGGAGLTFYNYPELRENPRQMLHAMVRGFRCGKTCFLMATEYPRAGNNITTETHSTAAARMFECFCANGGPYIKIGQMFGQL